MLYVFACPILLHSTWHANKRRPSPEHMCKNTSLALTCELAKRQMTATCHLQFTCRVPFAFSAYTHTHTHTNWRGKTTCANAECTSIERFASAAILFRTFFRHSERECREGTMDKGKTFEQIMYPSKWAIMNGIIDIRLNYSCDHFRKCQRNYFGIPP